MAFFCFPAPSFWLSDKVEDGQITVDVMLRIYERRGLVRSRKCFGFPLYIQLRPELIA